MSLRRSDTRKKKALIDIQQGVKVISHSDKADFAPDVDIVFVPGLGTDPENSWKSNNNDFNWMSHKDGILKDFPRARILLYQYESSWSGALKVKQFMHNVAMTLLLGLRGQREKSPQRPLILIGHSMGGLVVAKAVTIADSRRDLFPTMFETIAGCVFFGTPFNGAPAAATAAMLAVIGEKIDQTTSSKLLELMRPGNETLRELKNEFMRLVGKLSQKIELFCFWEEQPTNFAALGGLPTVFGLAIPKNVSEFVNRDSATLTGIDSMGLACIHRDLVKFDGPKDGRYQLVREPLKQIIHGAQLVVKNRFNSTRNIDRGTIKDVMDVLAGAEVQRKRKALEGKHVASSWLTTEQEYQQWLAKDQSVNTQMKLPGGDCLWIRGAEGRGKTSGTLAVLDSIESMIKVEEEQPTGQAPTLFAYFFCDPSTDYCTAEDLLKSFLRQLVDQQPLLAPYAKHFVKKKGKDENSKSIPQLTVENMWQALQEMLCDEFIGSKVYFVVNNMHVLQDDTDATEKLTDFIKLDIKNLHNSSHRHVPVRWLFTSRENHNIEQALNNSGTRLIDLEDEKYGNQVQLELRKHAHAKVSVLREEKRYNKAVAYLAHSVIGKRAQNTQWIDIVCVQLKGLPDDTNDLKVRQLLEAMPQDLTSLLDRAWQQVFSSNLRNMEMIKEVLRVLVLTFEDPTESELCILTGSDASEEGKIELRHLVDQCRPLLIVKGIGQSDAKVCFMNIFVKTHLLENANKILGLPEDATKWQHGVLALRAFMHVTKCLDFPEPEKKSTMVTGFEQGKGEDENEDENEDEEEGQGGGGEEEEEEEEDDEGEGEENEEEDEVDEEASEPSYGYSDSDDDDGESEVESDEEADRVKDKALAYTVKYWLRHASKATKEIAEDLSEEVDFWKPNSLIRRRWLIDYDRLTEKFDGFNAREFSALHVVASVGFAQLVVALLKKGYQEELALRDSYDNTPLHFAAHYGQHEIIEELLNRGADLDDGINEGFQTPLHMAAYQGDVKTMKKLISHGANIHAMAYDDLTGPIVNAAIYSGNREAVKILVDKGISLSVENEAISPPLALATMYSDLTMFDYLVQTCGHVLTPREFDTAFLAAAGAGRLEVFEKLLIYEHPQECFQQAIDKAACEGNWQFVTLILEKCPDLDCTGVFLEAAKTTEQQDKVLRDIWQHARSSISAEALEEALYSAIDCEKQSTVKLLLEEFEANPNATGEESVYPSVYLAYANKYYSYGNALTAAAYDGTIDIVEMLLEKGADVNDPNGWALQSAAAEGHQEVLHKLLACGADVNAITTNENFPEGTALQAACEAGRIETVELLLQHGANPNLGSGLYTCPLIAASMTGEERILELLVEAKADVNVLGGPNSSTSLINAASFLPLISLELLLDAGADINLADEDGNTALLAAAGQGDHDVVEFLLEKGADIMHSNDEGKNALQVAFESENQECLKLLIDTVSAILRDMKTATKSRDSTAASTVHNNEAAREVLSNDVADEDCHDNTHPMTHDFLAPAIHPSENALVHEEQILTSYEPEDRSDHEPVKAPKVENSDSKVNEQMFNGMFHELDGNGIIDRESSIKQPEMRERQPPGLQSAADEWKSLFNQYPSRQMGAQSNNTEATKPVSIESNGKLQYQESRSINPTPIQQWVQQVEPDLRDSAPPNGPGAIRRKPAPGTSQSAIQSRQPPYSTNSNSFSTVGILQTSPPQAPVSQFQEPLEHQYTSSSTQSTAWINFDRVSHTSSPSLSGQHRYQSPVSAYSSPQRYDNNYTAYNPQTYQVYRPLDHTKQDYNPSNGRIQQSPPIQQPQSPPPGGYYSNPPPNEQKYPSNGQDQNRELGYSGSRPELRPERSSFFGMKTLTNTKNLVRGVRDSLDRKGSGP